MTRASRGFTLAELAVALVIMALLFAGALIPLSTQIEVRNIADTQRTVDHIREAVIGFAMANGRLPCPARGQTPAGETDSTTWSPTSIAAGAEQWDPANNRCFVVFGVVPWATLGVPEVDAWGRRFSYRVAPAFADGIYMPSPPNPPGTLQSTWQTRASAYTPPAGYLAQNVSSPVGSANQDPSCHLTTAPTQASFALCSLGDIAVFTRSESTHARVTIGSALPAVIISHGRNGYGAFQPSGTRVVGSGDGDGDGVPDQNADEGANANGTATPINPLITGGYNQWPFYSRPPVSASSGCSDATAGSPLCEFDDIVVMLSSSTLMGRMVSAGRLP